MSDLPDYQRNIQIVAGEADVAEYNSAPEDIEDGERGPLLVDIKGRLYTLADIKKIAGVDVSHDGLGRMEVLSNVSYIKGIGLKDPYVAKSIPISLEGGEGWDPCEEAWSVYVRGIAGAALATESTLLAIKGYVDAVETLLAGGLPVALDTGALKIKEQSPLSAIKLWDGTNYLATPGVGDAIGRGVFILGSDYGSPTPVARIVKVDSSGRLSCVLE